MSRELRTGIWEQRHPRGGRKRSRLNRGEPGREKEGRKEEKNPAGTGRGGRRRTEIIRPEVVERIVGTLWENFFLYGSQK